MTDSPVTTRHRLLTRTDSIRFFGSRGAISFTYGFTFASIIFMLFLVLTPSYQFSRKYQLSKVFAHIFTNSTFSPPPHSTTNDIITSHNNSHSKNDDEVDHRHSSSQISRKEGSRHTQKNSNQKGLQSPTASRPSSQNVMQSNQKGVQSPTASRASFQNVTQSKQHGKELRNNCDMFEGSWIIDDSYPLYKSGSCPHIDEPFNCFLNGRSDNMYEKFRWQPKNCNMPRYFFDKFMLIYYQCM